MTEPTLRPSLALPVPRLMVGVGSHAPERVQVTVSAGMSTFRKASG